MKRVLMLCYYYPPQGGVGCVRSVGFSGNLARHGWEPHVLSVSNPFKPMMPVTGEHPPEGVRVSYARNWFNYPVLVEAALRRLGVTDQVLVPDPWVCWIPGAIIRGRGILDDQRFDAVYVTCAPFSAALAAMYLARRNDLPLVVDLRDEWTLNPNGGHYLLDALEEIDQGFEAEVLESADVIVCAWEGIADKYKRRYPSMANRFVTIPTGFDPSTVPTARRKTETFTITYTGFFYGTQTPALLFEALERVCDDGRADRDRVRFVWTGRSAPWVLDLARAHGIADLIDYRGLVTKAAADAVLVESDLLYFMIGATDGDDQGGRVLAKTFPYIASGTPILAQCAEGASASLIRRYSPSSTVVTTGKAGDLADAIAGAYARWHRGEPAPVHPGTNVFRTLYAHEATARQLALMLDHAVVSHLGRNAQQTP